jgi:tRNA nucleotidyltransferase/poly(A) polymerase
MRRELEEYVDKLGLDAYLVGGAVRDELLGHESKDADSKRHSHRTERSRT